jgi:16S rRNA (adenine1518-N6/adenine1519-N6)-dimethyltransferase
MVQLEVAQRIAAAAGSWTYLGAAGNLVALPRIVRRVAAGAFFPVPRVSSAVVRLDLLPEPRVAIDDVDAFLALLRAGFTQPRKQVHNSLAQGLGIPAEEVRRILSEAGIDPTRRPGALALADWAAVDRAVRQRER